MTATLYPAADSFYRSCFAIEDFPADEEPFKRMASGFRRIANKSCFSGFNRAYQHASQMP